MLTVKPDEVKIIPNMRSLFSIDECDTSVGYVLSAGVVELGTFARAASTCSFWCTAKPDYIDCPFVLSRSVGDDLIVGAIKLRGEDIYYHGVPAPKVKSFTAPSRGDIHMAELWVNVKASLDSTRQRDWRRVMPRVHRWSLSERDRCNGVQRMQPRRLLPRRSQRRWWLPA